jgi:hypothetical protein
MLSIGRRKIKRVSGGDKTKDEWEEYINGREIDGRKGRDGEGAMVKSSLECGLRKGQLLEKKRDWGIMPELCWRQKTQFFGGQSINSCGILFFIFF